MNLKRLKRSWSNPAAFIGLALLVLVLGLSGCGSGRKTKFGEETNQSNLFDVVWVEPQIVLSDSLITLIRSDRVDTLAADPGRIPEDKRASVDFQIDLPLCDVDVSLLDSRQNLLRPLLVQKLTAGFYRLNLQADRFREPSLLPGEYYLQVRYCDYRYLRPFVYE